MPREEKLNTVEICKIFEVTFNRPSRREFDFIKNIKKIKC